MVARVGRSAWRMGAGGQSAAAAGPRRGTPRSGAAARLPGRLACRFRQSPGRTPAGMGHRRHRPGTPAALAAGRLRAWDRALFRGRSRTAVVGGSFAGGYLRVRRGARPKEADRFPAGACRGRRSRRLCRGDAQDRAGGASGSRPHRRECDDRGLRRGARGARAHRPHRRSRAVVRRRAAGTEARARARLGPQGHRAAGRQLCEVPRPAQPAARTAASRRLRLCPRSLFSRHRRDRLRAGRDPHRRAARAARPVAALCHDRARHPRRASTRASARRCRATRARSPRR